MAYHPALAPAQGRARGRLGRGEERGRKVFSDFETIAAPFTATDQALGRESYRLEARAEGGRSASRLSRTFRVEVVRQKYRIMYLAGRPGPEYAYLREFLKADPNHELVSFVILRNPQSAAVAAEDELSLIPFPAEDIFLRTISQFDLFILENFSAARFNLPPSYLQSLKAFISGGGALLVIGGENAFGLGGYRGSPLEEVLPVTLSEEVPDFAPGRFQALPAAAEHPLVALYDSPEASKAAWAALPAMDGWGRFKAVRPTRRCWRCIPGEDGFGRAFAGGRHPGTGAWQGHAPVLGLDLALASGRGAGSVGLGLLRQVLDARRAVFDRQS